MKSIHFTLEWCRRMAELEGDAIISVGTNVITPLLNQEQKSESKLENNLGFGLFVKYMRLKRKLSEESLAKKIDVDVNDIMHIENDVQYEPEPRIVYQLASFFQVPTPRLMQISGLSIIKDKRLYDETVKFAASSNPSSTLSHGERVLLETFVSVLNEQE